MRSATSLSCASLHAAAAAAEDESLLPASAAPVLPLAFSKITACCHSAAREAIKAVSAAAVLSTERR